MKLFVLQLLFLGVSFSTALTLVSQEESVVIPVEQPYEKYEETESYAKIKKWDLSTHLFRTITVDFHILHAFDFIPHVSTLISTPVSHGPDCSRAPPIPSFC